MKTKEAITESAAKKCCACLCYSWVRDDEAIALTEGILTNHHPRCPTFEGKKMYFRITLDGGGSYIQPIDQLHTAMDGEIDGASIGTKWTVELIEMFEEQYKGLPEFAGH